MAPCCARSAGMEGDENDNCGHCRTWEEELYWNCFQSFSFFQSLSSVPEFHNQLAIPKKFANNARALLPTIVTLRGPSRATWSAIMIKRGDGTFLTDGWEEFVRAYSLQATDILIFKFDGVSAFDIHIYDGESQCEKESTYFVKKCGHETNYAENPRKRGSTEIDIEEYSDGLTHRATKKAREEVVNAVNAPPNNKSFSTETPRDTPHINGSNLTEASPQLRHETNGRCSNTISLASNRKIQKKVSLSKAVCSQGRPRKQLSANKAGDDVALGKPDFAGPDVSEEGRLALEMARKQMTANSFIAVMRPTSVCGGYKLNFPRPWCRKHLSHVSQDLFLRFGDETFLTRLSYSPRKVAGQVIRGWRRVVEANQLKLDDVCLFNIAGRKNDALLFDVSVFRAGLQQIPNEPVNGELLPKAEIM